MVNRQQAALERRSKEDFKGDKDRPRDALPIKDLPLPHLLYREPDVMVAVHDGTFDDAPKNSFVLLDGPQGRVELIHEKVLFCGVNVFEHLSFWIDG